MMQDVADFFRGAADRFACARGVLDEDACGAFHRFERLRDRFRHALRGFLRITIARGARMKADLADAQCGRALQLFCQPGTRARPLVRIRGRNAEDVRGMDEHVLGLHAGFGERGLKARYAIRVDRALVTIEFWNGGKDLNRAHARIRGSAHRHIDPAVVHGMCADPVLSHGLKYEAHAYGATVFASTFSSILTSGATTTVASAIRLYLRP